MITYQNFCPPTMGQTLVPELCPQSSQQMNPHNNIGNHENLYKVNLRNDHENSYSGYGVAPLRITLVVCLSQT